MQFDYRPGGRLLELVERVEVQREVRGDERPQLRPELGRQRGERRAARAQANEAFQRLIPQEEASAS